MSTGDDDVSSGINGRLRPRKSNVSSPQTTKTKRKSDRKPSQERTKRITTPPKALLNKPDDLSNKSESTSVIDFLCPYCDKKFISKQALSKHTRRIHFSTTKPSSLIQCLYCAQVEAGPNELFRHMTDNHSNLYFACLDCHTRFPSTTDLAEHNLGGCEKPKHSYRSKLRQKLPRKSRKSRNTVTQDILSDENRRGFNGVVISCELKPTHVHDDNDIEDNITTNLILPSNKTLVNTSVIDKNAVIVLDDLQWNKRIPHNFSFHNTDADQILSRLGVVHRSPRTGESARKDWFKAIDETTQKFERCFDTGFYSRVASNVQENLGKFLDGSFNFNPDPDQTIKTRKAKNSVPINTVEGFPILLACEQYSRNIFDGYMPRAIAPKHKWKWENSEDRNLLNPDQIKRDNHVNNCIVTLVSSLDIWTQLCMRRKFEEKYKSTPVEKNVVKQNMIGKELKEILESRELPSTSTSSILQNYNPPPLNRDGFEFPASLGLLPTVPKYETQSAILSGEWVRPRCYVCCACGSQTTDSRGLTSHMSTQHPNAQVQYYEIVGEFLLNSDILKHLYVPPSQIQNKTRPSRGYRECTKCNKSITLEDLHQHMLDCAGDMPTVRRKCRYRPFGVRKRRQRVPDNRIHKKIRKNIHRQNGKSIHRQSVRPRPKIRSEVGDAETIRKMIADLPAKRHRVMVNPLNAMLRPSTKIKQRNKLVLKQRTIDETKNIKNDVGSASHGNVKMVSNANHIVNEQDENRMVKTTIKRVRRRVSNSKDILVKHNSNRPRRKPAQLKQSESIQPIENKNDDQPAGIIVPSEHIQTEHLSGEATPSRINVNCGPNNTRDHSNRSNSNGSNNRDNQNPERNDNNGNNREQPPPQQNIQLKHSIARLTADTDTQDKAVQFHHLFLVQQECNNVTQHDPSGQHVLFEKKAVGTKLDKPPLSVFEKEDKSENNQKNKQSKPRKGLNDCIAMLKNKLVEPLKSPDVSIQCEIDKYEIESSPKQKPKDNLNVKDKNIQCPDNIAKPATETTVVLCRKQEAKNNSLEISANKKLHSLRDKTPSKQVINLPSESIVQKINEGRKNDLVVDVIPFKTSTSATKTRNNKSEISITPHVPETNNKAIPSPKSVTHSDVKQTITTKSEEVQCETGVKHAVIQKSTKNDQTAKVIAPQPRLILPLPEKQELISNNNISQDVITDINVTKSIEPDIQSKLTNVEEENFKKKDNDCIGKSNVETETNMESAVAIPLDLSGKSCTNQVVAHCSTQIIDPSPTNHQTGLNDYQCFETLDLSKKGFNKENDHYAMQCSEEVVDLSVKFVKPPVVLASTSNASKNNIDSSDFATDLSLKYIDENCLPTDLSLKGRSQTASNYISTDNRNKIDVQQELYKDVNSSQSNTVCLNLSAKLTNSDAPTDLSKRSVSTAADPRCMPNNTYTNSSVSNVIINVKPDDLANRMYKSNELSPTNNSCVKKINLPKYSIEDINNTKSYNINEQNIYETPVKRSQFGVTEILSKSNSVTTTDFNQINDPRPLMQFSNTSETFKEVTKERKSIIYDLTKPYVAITTSITQIESSLPDYSFSKKTIPKSVSKQDNSKLVYTLANKCIPVTKENSDTALLSGAFLSIPCLTTCNTSSVYTIAGTSTVGSPNLLPFSQQSHNFTIKEAQVERPLQAPSSDKTLEIRKDPGVINKNVSINDHDPETAKKIAMLPKELVDILGNMPSDHRNQLLNVLPQYVSASTSPLPNKSDVDINSKCNYHNVTISNSKALKDCGTSISLSDYPSHSTQQSSNLISQKSESNTAHYDTGTFPQTSNNYKNSCELIHKEVTEIINLSIEPKVTEAMQTGKQSNVNCANISSSVIDLTDDCLQPATNLAPVGISPHKDNINLNILKPASHKSINEKTASLRAVRIKAPSERHKSLRKTETNIMKSYQENNNTININNTDNQSLRNPQNVHLTLSKEEESNSVILKAFAAPVTKVEIPITEDEVKKVVETEATSVNTLTTLPVIIDSTKDICKNEVNKLACDDQSKKISSNSSSCLINTLLPITINIENKSIRNDNEDDDSEDDISLAIIVKQKQFEQSKTANLTDNNNVKVKETLNTILKKDEKLKSKQLKSNNTLDETNNLKAIPPHSGLKLNETVDSNTCLSLNEDGNVESKKVKQRKNKKKAKRTQRKVSDTPYELNYSMNPKSETNSAIGINKSSVVLQDKPAKLQSSDISYNECNHQNEEALTTDNKYNTVENTKSNKKYKTTTIRLNSVLENDEKQESVEKCCELKVQPKKYETLESKLNTPEKFNLNNINDPCISTSSTEFGSETVSPNEDIHSVVEVSGKVTKNLTFKLEQSAATPEFSQDTKQIIVNAKTETNLQEIITPSVNATEEENQATPLRRSRRGKSLFIESNELMIDNKIQTGNLERAPLTKKHLIFSKLLLDGEKKETKDPIGDDIPENNVDQQDNFYTLPSETEANLALNIKDVKFLTKKFSVKRKQSPQIKKKNKKKKPIVPIHDILESTLSEVVSVITTENTVVKDPQAVRCPQSVNDNTASEMEDNRMDSKDPVINLDESKDQVMPMKCGKDKEQLNVDKPVIHLASAELEKVSEPDTLSKSDEQMYGIANNQELSESVLETIPVTDIQKSENINLCNNSEKMTVSSNDQHRPESNNDKEIRECNKLLTISITDKCNSDVVHSSKPKKSSQSIITDYGKNNMQNCERATVKNVTCYNKPASRRVRSKSVFVNSTTSEFYDPYDIDLEDMAEKTKPIIKKSKNSTKKRAKKLSITETANDNIPSNSQVLPNKSKDETVEKKINKTQCFAVDTIVDTRGAVSDSDDSSKSDIPLKKIIEEKQRKNAIAVIADEEKVLLTKNKDKDVLNPEKIENALQEENERLRSEQFMESFGFFSERKPRKSNLLATKKISETFHNIASDNDDGYFTYKDKCLKKSTQNEIKKSVDDSNIISPVRKGLKRGKKKKISMMVVPTYCDECKKDFRRPDNYVRHQMTLSHASKVSEVELKTKILTVDNEPNYLVVFKQQLDKLKIIQDKIMREKKYCKRLVKIPMPSLEEIITDITLKIKQNQLARRELSRDEALFLDCCELLNASHKEDSKIRDRTSHSSEADPNCFNCTKVTADCLNLLEKQVNECLEGKYDDGDIDSITAQNILESEEVRNLENDLISGLKEAACANYAGSNIDFSKTLDIGKTAQKEYNVLSTEEDCKESEFTTKLKKVHEVKDKMYPDIINDIDMFEDKFDKIKRKCRSQAAAAKQSQYVADMTISHKSKKKVEKRKGKKNLKKILQTTVPTKGALKGYDGVKVSISTTNINMSSIISPIITTKKKKKRSNSKRKRDRKGSLSSSKYDADQNSKNLAPKKLDVYEFMDNEDIELFELRPSTLMERFKNIGKDKPSTSKTHTNVDPELSSASVSDGDDFVYMSDDYVCSDAETENSLMSCELASAKAVSETRKIISLVKRKEPTEKSAVMGKIFKHNAVRCEKKSSKAKESTKPKANLDQLFDSLLEDEPNTSTLAKSSLSPKCIDDDIDDTEVSNNDNSKHNIALENYDQEYLDQQKKHTRSPSPIPYSVLVSKSRKRTSLSTTSTLRSSDDDIEHSSPEEHRKHSHNKKSHHASKCKDVDPSRDSNTSNCDNDLPNKEFLSKRKSKKSKSVSDYDEFSFKHKSKKKSKEDLFSTAIESDTSLNNDNSILDDENDATFIKPMSKERASLSSFFRDDGIPRLDKNKQKSKDFIEKCSDAEISTVILPKRYSSDDDNVNFAKPIGSDISGEKQLKSSLSNNRDDNLGHRKRKSCEGYYESKSSKKTSLDDDSLLNEVDIYKHTSKLLSNESHEFTSRKRKSREYDFKSEDSLLDDDEVLYTKHKIKGKKSNLNFNDSDSMCCNRQKTKEHKLKMQSSYEDSLLRESSLSPNERDFTVRKRDLKEKELNKKILLDQDDHDGITHHKPKSTEELRRKSDEITRTSLDINDSICDYNDETGVARQRARRKCTVGKQNVLAETWSSESEPDGVPPRPNSAESVVVGLGRKKKGRKKEGQATSRKAGRQVSAKRNDIESRVFSRIGTSRSEGIVPMSRPSALCVKPKPRAVLNYWSGGEDEQERVEQHGWIVGDSHKKLVTMLAHAKGKRNHDDRRHLVD